jgi:hypothetical protein
MIERSQQRIEAVSAFSRDILGYTGQDGHAKKQEDKVFFVKGRAHTGYFGAKIRLLADF